VRPPLLTLSFLKIYPERLNEMRGSAEHWTAPTRHFEHTHTVKKLSAIIQLFLTEQERRLSIFILQLEKSTRRKNRVEDGKKLESLVEPTTIIPQTHQNQTRCQKAGNEAFKAHGFNIRESANLRPHRDLNVLDFGCE
jgi:hypothetical protein